jgi:hypothetical protein
VSGLIYSGLIHQHTINEMHRIQSDVKTLLSTAPSFTDCVFAVHDLKHAISRFSAHKNDGSTGVTSDHIINAGDDCLTHIALLFTAIVVRAVANYRIQCGLHNSFMGRNASFSARRYNCRYHDISSGNVNAQHIINNYVDNLSVDRHLQLGCMFCL